MLARPPGALALSLRARASDPQAFRLRARLSEAGARTPVPGPAGLLLLGPGSRLRVLRSGPPRRRGWGVGRPPGPA
eukprot:6417514-Alexandrium_andersonii.AAC.1